MTDSRNNPTTTDKDLPLVLRGNGELVSIVSHTAAFRSFDILLFCLNWFLFLGFTRTHGEVMKSPIIVMSIHYSASSIRSR